MLYKKLQDLFDPRVVKPYHNHAKVINIRGRNLAVDIFYLKTKTNVGQFLITIQPILKLTNLLLTEMSLADP